MSVANRYQLPDISIRLTDELIMTHIDAGSRVIDLGCGDGRLLERLRREMRCTVMGVDLEQSNLVSVIQRGVPAVKADLDEGLRDIPTGSYDFAVLSQTLQQVRQPRQLLLEMLRVARNALIVVPNFGYWRVRLEVLWRGRTPVTGSLPYEWYDTPNLHFMSMYDFRDLMESSGLTIVRESPIIHGHAVDRAWAANLRADSAFYLLEKRDSSPNADQS